MGRIAITGILAALGGIALYLHVEHPARLAALCREDGILEYGQSLFYLLASLCFVVGLARLRFRNIWYWGYAILFFFLAGEEISWGQRILDIQTPDVLMEANEQKELTLHNIKGIHGSIRALGLLVVLTIAFVIPAAERWVSPARALIRRWRHPVFPMWAGALVVIAILFMLIPRLVQAQNYFEMDEVGESFLAVSMLIFGTTVINGRNPNPSLQA